MFYYTSPSSICVYELSKEEVQTNCKEGFWRYSLTDFDRTAELLDVIEWEEILPDDVESYWTALKSYFLQVMEMCIPHAVIKFTKNVPWMNSAIGNAIKKRVSLFLIAKRSSKPTDRIKYNIQQNKVSMIRQSKQSFFDKMNTADSSNFWKFVHRLNQQQSLIPTLQSNGVSVKTRVNKATVLNNYFYNRFNHDFPTL